MSSSPQVTAEQDGPIEDGEIYHYSPNPENEGPTIIFIHGITSSNAEFSLVLPYLKDDYHIILVDLPGHSKSKHIPGPHTYQQAAEYVQRIIQNHAHGGHAYVVGLSLGGFVGQHLTTLYPDRVLKLFTTGSAPLIGARKWLARKTWLVYSFNDMWVSGMPDWLYQSICDWSGLPRDLEFREEMARNSQHEMIKETITSLLEFNEDAVSKLAKTGVKVLVLAGAKGDDVASTKQMGNMLRNSGSPGSTAMAVKDATHAWDRQFPELFAAGIRAWIEDGSFPEQYRTL